MACSSGECPIKKFLEQVKKQAMDSYHPPFVVPKNVDEVKSQLQKNIHNYDDLYLLIRAVFIALGSFLAHPLAGILSIVIMVGLAFVWPKFIEKYVEKYMKEYKIPYCSIPIALFPLFLIFALLGESCAMFVVFVLLAEIITIVHAIFQRYGKAEQAKEKVSGILGDIKKNMPVVQTTEEPKKKKSSSSSSSSDDKKKK